MNGTQRPIERADVSAAELDRMDTYRRELVQQHPVFPTCRQRMDFGVGGKRRFSEAAEQPHHREVELTMTAETRRVDQPGAPVPIDNVPLPNADALPATSVPPFTDVPPL